MMFYKCIIIAATVSLLGAVQYPMNPTSEMSTDERIPGKDQNKTVDLSEQDDSEHEPDIEKSVEETKDKKFLSDAMKTVLDPASVIESNNEVIDKYKETISEITKEDVPLDRFIETMDKLSLDVCKKSQEALWSYVTDISNNKKKNDMILVSAQEDEIKKQYWNNLKKKYLNEEALQTDQKLKRKFRIIKERGTNVQMPQSKQRQEIDNMQRIWSHASVCAFNSSSCAPEGTGRTMSDIISVFKTSNSSKELAYYWKAFRDATGKKIRPLFKEYVTRMNRVAESENFTDAGDMWRFSFEDDSFEETVNRIWLEIKPIYDLIREYVRAKLKVYYKNEIQGQENTLPAHLLGNLWAQEWQALYPKIQAYPEHKRAVFSENNTITSRQLFDAVDQFHQSLGFTSAKESYEDIGDAVPTANCLPSSHDMCDGQNYRIKWCGESSSEVAVGLSRAARLLGHVQYFKHYRNLPPLYRDGPTPAFHDAISDIVAVQVTTPEHLKKLNFLETETGPEVTINHLLWLSLEKFPLMAYAYVLDRWRWQVFANSSSDDWNQNWWDLRTQETGVSAPVYRNESDLDPAAKYHVVSHVQYITYLISHILEFQILMSLCKVANHTGPLHECSLHGVEEAGNILSKGMSLGASEDWRTVLQTMTGETELSTKGILEYFKPLQEFLEKENLKLASVTESDMDQSAPIIVGIILFILTIVIVLMYFLKKNDYGHKILSICGLSKNGSLDIAANELSQGKVNEAVDAVIEDKV